MRRNRLLVSALVLMLLTVSGCWDAASPEQMAWVAALGVDHGPDGNFVFTFQTLAPKSIAAGGAQSTGTTGGKGHSYLVFSVAAPDVITATELSDAFVSRHVSLHHAKVIVLGESIVRQGISEFLAPAVRFRDFRRTLYVMVAKGSAQEFLNYARPRLENDPSLWYETMMHWQEETNLVPPTRIHEMVLSLERAGVGARVALVAARPDLDGPESELSGRIAAGPSDILAGDLYRTGVVPVEFLGSAVFKGAKLAGFLTGEETRMVSLMRGELDRRTPVTVPDPRDPQHRVVLLAQVQKRPVIRVAWKEGRLTANIRVNLEGDIGSVPSVIDYTHAPDMALLERATERFLKARVEQVMNRTLHEWGTDLYRIGDQAKTAFPTLQAWQAYDWSRRVADVDYSVDLSFRIRRHGQQQEPAKPQR